MVLLNYGDIRSARLVRERVTKPDMNNRRTTEIIHWVELELAVDPAPLAEALATEGARPPVMEKRWYGTSGTMFRDYPVMIQTPPFVRIKWQVVPRGPDFLEALQGRVAIEPEVRVREDFTNLRGLPPDQQEKRLRMLTQRGEDIAAVYLAQRLRGGGLGEAKEYVESLRKGPES